MNIEHATTLHVGVSYISVIGVEINEFNVLCAGMEGWVGGGGGGGVNYLRAHIHFRFRHAHHETKASLESRGGVISNLPFHFKQPQFACYCAPVVR